MPGVCGRAKIESFVRVNPGLHAVKKRQASKHVMIFFILLPNVPGQTCGPCAIAFMGTVNRVVCSRWLGSVFISLKVRYGFIRRWFDFIQADRFLLRADGLNLITLRPVASHSMSGDFLFSDILVFRFTDVVRFPKSEFSVFPPTLYAFDY